MVTCFHECRHAYQAYSVKHNLNESKEILNKWNNDFNTYNMPSGTLDEKADINYLTQPIEIDAIIWTHIKIKELFEVKEINKFDLEMREHYIELGYKNFDIKKQTQGLQK